MSKDIAKKQTKNKHTHTQKHIKLCTEKTQISHGIHAV